jgi:hypothetical protein
VNAVLLLTGLLVLAYLGSFLVGGRTVRGAGLPSGVEFVALGCRYAAWCSERWGQP